MKKLEPLVINLPNTFPFMHPKMRQTWMMRNIHEYITAEVDRVVAGEVARYETPLSQIALLATAGCLFQNYFDFVNMKVEIGPIFTVMFGWDDAAWFTRVARISRGKEVLIATVDEQGSICPYADVMPDDEEYLELCAERAEWYDKHWVLPDGSRPSEEERKRMREQAMKTVSQVRREMQKGDGDDKHFF